ncbi:helix-turn-helix domain-containing protein [Alkalibacillus silvisoli]|uniref:Rgg/GadR/MutR family transcriptional regulator n=1 Tax=Alkalibacillus silvisoli TaxID=392823 RepID=A0ABN0ZWG1_9BACI
MNYGHTFRKIREQKGFTLEDIGSVSFLSKFETGESDISIQDLYDFLERIGLTLDEFLFIHHDGERPPGIIEFFNQAYDAYVKRDVNLLQEMHKGQMSQWEEHGLRRYRLQADLVKIYESLAKNREMEQEDGELQEIKDYLFKVEAWTLYELRLYSSVMMVLDEIMVITLTKEAYKKSKNYHYQPQVRDTINNILLNTLSSLLGPINQPNRLINTQAFLYFLEALEANCLESDFVLKSNMMQLRGLYEVKKGNITEGVEMVKGAVDLLNQFQASNLAQDAERYMKLILRYK